MPPKDLALQVFGTKNCPDTRKAERFFKERNIRFQFVDLKIKGMSKRELETVARKTGYEALLDKEGKRFVEKGLAYMSPGRTETVLLEDPLLLRTPIVRSRQLATVGFCPDEWKTWLA